MFKYFILLLSFGTLLFATPLSFTSKITPKTKRTFTYAANKLELMVHVNPSALQKNRSIMIDLPLNLALTFKNDKYIFRKDGDFVWSGKSANGDTILLTTKSGATYGVIIFNKERYVVQKNVDGSYKIFKEAKVETDKDDIIKFPQKKSIELYPSGLNESYVAPLVSNDPVTSSTNEPKIAALDINSSVDVMILYTQSYADYYGSGLDAKIQYSIDYANIAMQNSEVALSFHLAHQELYENAASNESAGIYNALAHIQSSDAVKQLRAQYHIDITSLFHLNTEGGTVGLGYLPYANSRSSIRASSYTVSSYSDIVFAHESGHNFGCGHDWDLDNCSDGGGLFSYSCGFVSSGIGTIMSYTNSIQYFSNPNLTFNGVTIGVAEGGTNPADCARTINETRTIMAQNDDISETNEAGDSLTGESSPYVMTGNLNPIGDRDSFLLSLGGDTTISMSSQYGNIAFYANLYTEDGYLIRSFITASETVSLDNGKYILVFANEDDTSSTYYATTINYTVNITSNYVAPSSTLAPSIVMYLLN